jgi:hypothetical protein
MYLRESRQKLASGTLTYLQLVESVWNPDKRQSEIRVLFNFGRTGDPAVTERLRRLAHSILRRCSPEDIIIGDPSWKWIEAWPYGEVYVLQALWERLGIDEIIDEQAGKRRLGFSVERALFAMVANRACAPASKLYCYEQWLREDVRIADTESLELQHLYRAMDFLEAHKEAIERAIFFRVADLLSLDVDVIFYDTTSLHFAIDEEDRGAGDNDEMRGAAGPREPNATARHANVATRRTGALTCRRSWWAWRSRARAFRCATGCFRATPWTSRRSNKSKRNCQAGSSRVVCS